MAKVCHFETPEAIPNTSGVSSEVQQLPVAEPPVVWNDLDVSNPSEPQSIIKDCDTSALLNVKNRKLRNLTYYNNNIIKLADVLKRSYHTISTFTLKEHKHCVWDHHFDIDWTHEVKIIRESERTWVLIQKYILMRDRRRRENNKHAPRAAFLLFVDFYIAFESVIQSSFEFFVSIHLLLVFDCPFFVGQRVVSI